MKTKKVALVLSGGSALGFAHIGVIKALEKHNIPINIIVGTSMGGLVGAAYAEGLTIKQMTDFATKFKNTHFFDVNFDWSGLFSGKGMMKTINKILPDKNIEDLNKTYACVACDLLTEKEIIFTKGSIRDAVRATISIPGFFVPLYKDNMVLVDGGIKNNLPDDVARKLGADIVISCDVLEYCKLTKKPRNILDTLIYSINCSTKEIQRLRSNKSDIIIRPNLTGLTQMGYNKTNVLKAIREGEKETEKYIDEILELLK